MAMLKFYLLVFVQMILFTLNAQKVPLDFSVLGKWPSVENPKISNDGKYVIYTYRDSTNNLVIKATEGTYERWMPGTGSSNAIITENSQYVIAKAEDSLLIIEPAKNQERIITGVLSFKTPKEGTGEWLAYELNNAQKTLVVYNLNNGKESRFYSISEYLFSQDGNVLLLKKQEENDSCTLQLLDPSTGRIATIWCGAKSDNFKFDPLDKSLAFVAEDRINNSFNALWYYRIGMDKATLLANKNTHGIDQGLLIANEQLKFNKSGTKLFFNLGLEALPKPKSINAIADIWNYRDAKLQSQQLNEVKRELSYLAVINLDNNHLDSGLNKVIRIEKDHEQVDQSLEEMNDDYVLITRRQGDANESNWNQASFVSVYLVSTKDGERKLLKENVPFASSPFSLSPGEKFIISYDGDKKCIINYENATEFEYEIGKDLPNISNKEKATKYASPYKINWLNTQKTLIVNDGYDLWQVDPLGIRKSINLTNGFGRLNKTVISVTGNGKLNSIDGRNSLVVISYNKVNKLNGFYRIILGKQRNPEILTEQQCIYYNPVTGNGFKPIKAKLTDVYLVAKMTSSEPPNYYVTRDFKSFKKLSNVSSPNKSYNWVTTDLIKWKTFYGNISQGVLYKPDNFDSTKKYPVIFLFYELKSDYLNEFIEPNYSEGEINIPYFVSNGYLVFTPDINYKISYPGESAVNSVVSAAKYLSKFSWIDSTKMGIMGHSFGAYEVNYIITHTDKFAAAVSAAGFCDLVSLYGSDIRRSYFKFWAEIDQGRLRKTLWENPKSYIINSPIFKANSVVSPLLMMNNKDDSNVPFSQGIEFFTALRRLGKKVWMLQYDGLSHAVVGSRQKIDYTKRIRQFFDHYLKDSACPRWMFYGIPAKDKGIDDGLQLVYEKDKNGKWLTPKEGGLLTDEEKKKVEALKHRKAVTVTIE
jgi:dipeptidyl aminopeptidase/acylaminoacyl peptidase